MICPNCGKTIPDHKVLCPECGEFLLADSLTSSSSTVSSEPPEPVVHKKVDPRTFQIHFEEDEPASAPLSSREGPRFDSPETAFKPANPPKDLGPAPAAFPGYETESVSPTGKTTTKTQRETVVKKKTVRSKNKKSARRPRDEADDVPQRNTSRRAPAPETTVIVKKKRGCGCGCITAVFLFFIGIFLIAFLVIQTLGMDTIRDYLDYFRGKDVSVSVDVNDKESQPEEVQTGEPDSAGEPVQEEEPTKTPDNPDKWAAVFEDLPEE